MSNTNYSKRIVCPYMAHSYGTLASPSIVRFYITWRKCIRRLFNLPRNTHCKLLPEICCDLPVHEQLYNRCVILISMLSNSKNSLSKLCYRLAINGSHSSLCNNIHLMSSYYRVPKYRLQFYKPTKVSSQSTISSVIYDLLSLRDSLSFCPNPIFDNEELNFMIVCLCTE